MTLILQRKQESLGKHPGVGGVDISTWLEGIYTEAGSLVGQLIVLGFSIYQTYIFQFCKTLCPTLVFLLWAFFVS